MTQMPENNDVENVTKLQPHKPEYLQVCEFVRDNYFKPEFKNLYDIISVSTKATPNAKSRPSLTGYILVRSKAEKKPAKLYTFNAKKILSNFEQKQRYEK